MKLIGLLAAASFYSKSLRCLRWTAGPKRPQLLLNMYSTRPQTRAYGACGATSGLKLLTVAYARHAFACANLDYATPCLAYSSGVSTSAHLVIKSHAPTCKEMWHSAKASGTMKLKLPEEVNMGLPSCYLPSSHLLSWTSPDGQAK